MTADIVSRARQAFGGEPANFIGSDRVALTGSALRSHYPASPSETIWEGAPDLGHVDGAVAAARDAMGAWSQAPKAKRIEVLRACQTLFRERQNNFAALICAETGKALWECKQEAAALAGKVDITLEEGPHTGMSRVEDFSFQLTDTRTGRTRFRPHGVMAVIGPFNFPAHLPNGHIIPALATGCTIIFKPSDKTPAVGQLLAQTFRDALTQCDMPAGVVNLVQGASDVASRLVSHDGVDGVLFTGSWPVGRKILEANLDTPGRIVALEMGGNNAAVVMADAHLKQAALECCRASFATTGQRCTCTRRIILHEPIAQRFLDAFLKCAAQLRVGDPVRDEPVFMGPVVRAVARDAALAFARDLEHAGAEALLQPCAITNIPGCEDGYFLSPGVFRVERFTAPSPDGALGDAGCDDEVFAPLVRVCVVHDLDEAIEQANATRYGLAASIFTTSEASQQRFLAQARAGCVNVNTGTAGASSKLPFGGVGLSGNHRPAAAFAMDYCAYPVASMIEQSDTAAVSPGMMFDDSWISQ